MIQVQVNSFKGWGYPFIARDLIGWENNGNNEPMETKYDDILLSGAVVFDDTTEDELKGFMNASTDLNCPAVMIDISNISELDMVKSVKATADKYFITDNNYEDSESYENRLSYVKPSLVKVQSL